MLPLALALPCWAVDIKLVWETKVTSMQITAIGANDRGVAVGVGAEIMWLSKSGNVSWRKSLEKQATYIKVEPDLLLVSAEDLYSVASDGTTRWRYDVPDHAASSAVVVGEQILIGTTTRLLSVDKQGHLIWSHEVPSPHKVIQVAPPQGDLLLYSRLSYRGKAFADAFSLKGAKLWSYELKSPAVLDSLVAPDGNLYLTGDFEIISLAPDGSLRWRVPIASRINHGNNLNENRLFIRLIDGRFCQLKADGTGLTIFGTEDGDYLSSKFVELPGERIVQTRRNRLGVFDKNGKVLANSTQESVIHGPLLIENNLIAIALADGRVQLLSIDE